MQEFPSMHCGIDLLNVMEAHPNFGAGVEGSVGLLANSPIPRDFR